MNIRVFLVLFMIGLGCGVNAQNKQGTEQNNSVFLENEPWETVLQKAKERNCLIFMDCYTAWCGPCKKLADKVFPRAEVQEFLGKHFVACKYDMEKGEGIELDKKYKENIPGYPTMLVINPNDEKVIYKIAGFREADVLIHDLQGCLDGKTISYYQKRYEAGERSLAFVKEYIQALENAYDEEAREKLIRDFVEALPVDSLMNKEIFRMYDLYLDDVYSQQYEFILEHKDDYYLNLNMQLYNIESLLNTAMRSAVDKLVKATLATTDTDSLKVLQDKEVKLKTFLKKDVRGFGKSYAKLAINDVRMTGDLRALDAILDADKLLRATNDEKAFLSQMYAYIVENAAVNTQKELLEKYLNWFEQEQEKEIPKGPAYCENYYNVLAVGYHRLGEKEKSEACVKEFERFLKEKNDALAVMYTDEKSRKILADNYERKLNELHAKLGKNK